MAARGRGLFSLYIYIEKISSCQKPLDRFQYNFAEMFLWWSSIKIVQAIWIHQKTWPPEGGAFSLYIYIENFKNLLVRNHWTDLNIILQKCPFGDPLPRHDSSKNMAARGWGLFSLYIYIVNFKNLLVRKDWSDFNITWQKCFLGDPLPRILSRHDLSKNMAASVVGAYFSYISI